jgi:hypothetical protein
LRGPDSVEQVVEKLRLGLQLLLQELHLLRTLSAADKLTAFVPAALLRFSIGNAALANMYCRVIVRWLQVPAPKFFPANLSSIRSFRWL